MIQPVCDRLRRTVESLKSYLVDNANQILSYENAIRELRKEEAETLEEIAANMAAIEKLES